MRFGVEITIMSSPEIGICPPIRIVPVGRLFEKGIISRAFAVISRNSKYVDTMKAVA